MLRTRAQMTLENVDSFQCMGDIRKNKSGPVKNFRALNFLSPRAQMVLEIFGIFLPLFAIICDWGQFLLHSLYDSKMVGGSPMLSFFVFLTLFSLCRPMYTQRVGAAQQCD